MAEYFAGGHLRFLDGEWRDDNGDVVEIREVKHGKWLPTNIPSYFGGIIYKCSECGAQDGDHSSILGRYCWRCGIKMDGSVEKIDYQNLNKNRRKRKEKRK